MEKRKITKNNIEIYHYPNDNTHSFCLSLYIKAGALYEADKDNGLTHFWEHAIFRNINHQMGGHMYEEIDKLGLYSTGPPTRSLSSFMSSAHQRILRRPPTFC